MSLGADLHAPSDSEALSLTSDRSRSLAKIMAAAEPGAMLRACSFDALSGGGGGANGGDGGYGGYGGGGGGWIGSGRGAGGGDGSSGGGTILTQGYLLKRSSNIRADWKRRFFILDALGHLTYYRDKDATSRAKETVSLLTATIKPDLARRGGADATFTTSLVCFFIKPV